MEQVTNDVLLVGENDATSACLMFLFEKQSIRRCRLFELSIPLLREAAPRIVLFTSFKDRERTIQSIDMVRWSSPEVSTVIFTGTLPGRDARSELDRRGVKVILKPDTKELIEMIRESARV